MRHAVISDDGAWLSPFAQQTLEQFEHDRCQRRSSWHILVHEQVFKQTSQSKDDKTKMFKHRTSTNAQTKMIKLTVRYTASAEQTVRRFFYGRGVGVSTLVNHMQSNSIDTTGIYAITYNKLLLH